MKKEKEIIKKIHELEEYIDKAKYIETTHYFNLVGKIDALRWVLKEEK